MNDERINERLNIIKRNNLIIIALVSLIFLVIKSLNNFDLIYILPEIYLLITPLIILSVAFFNNLKEDIKDERVYKNTLSIYNKGFWIVALSGIIVYFISILFIDFNLTSISFAPNTSINSIISWCMILTLINFRRNKLTFNPQIIEYNKIDYYKIVLRRILYIFLFYTITFIIVSIIKYFVDSDLTYQLIVIVILISFISIAIQYFLFSVYEKYHYDEMVLREDEGKQVYVSKKVWLIFLIISLFFLSLQVTQGLFNYGQRFDLIQSSPFYLNMFILSLFLRLQYLTVFVLSITMYVIIYKTFKQLDSKFKRIIPIIFIILSIFLLYNLFFNYYVLALNIGFTFGQESINTMILLSKISQYISNINLIFSLGVAIFIYLQNLKKEALLYFAGFSLLPILSFLILTLFTSFDNVLFFEFLIQIIMNVTALVFRLIAIRKLSNGYILKSIEN